MTEDEKWAAVLYLMKHQPGWILLAILEGGEPVLRKWQAIFALVTQEREAA